MSDLIQAHPQELVAFLRRRNIERIHLVYDPGSKRMLASHPELEPIAELISQDKRDFMEHEGVFLQVSSAHDTLQGAFVHRTVRGPGAGGVRYWSYDTVEDYLRDGLRLSKGMTRKNALAGLWWGGGKGVMAHNPAVDKHDPGVRESLYRDYGRLMTSLRGCYVTAEDVGTHVTDMANVFSTTRFTTCIPEELGGSGNPSAPTARGVVCGMEAGLESLGLGTLEGKRVAVQGMGNVGAPLIRMLLDKGVAGVVASDIDAATVERVCREVADRRLQASTEPPGGHALLEADCDILSPCATGAILNPETIPKIRARVVCGAANNQLEDTARDDRLLHERGVLYVPDFLTNRMGIVNCANEQDGYVERDPLFERHLSRTWEHSIHSAALRVFAEVKETGQPPASVAVRMADELSAQPHPVRGHRGRLIIDSLVATRWHET